jgi:hypothetical protein
MQIRIHKKVHDGIFLSHAASTLAPTFHAFCYTVIVTEGPVFWSSAGLNEENSMRLQYI